MTAVRFNSTLIDYNIYYSKNTAKNIENIPGLLHFFDIFCNSPGVRTVFCSDPE